jgi:hypothetical protein
VGQKTLGEGCESVEEIKVSWGVWLWVTRGVEWVERWKCHACDLRGLGWCGVGVPHSHERLGVNKEH